MKKKTIAVFMTILLSCQPASAYAAEIAYDFCDSPESTVTDDVNIWSDGDEEELFSEGDVVDVPQAKASGNCGTGVNWNLDTDGTLTISGSGQMEDGFGESFLPSYYQNAVKKVIIQNGITRIGGAAFFGLTNLKEVTIPESVTSIGYQAFSGCGMSTILIPASVTTIEEGAINSNSLTAIAVSDKNKNFTSVDGVLFSKDKTELVAYPGGKSAASYAIPEGTKKIGIMAFFELNYPKSIIVPASVEYIGEQGFGYMGKKLESIYFKGNAPVFDNNSYSDVFSYTTTTAYYPENNSTWTASSFIGSNVTWKTWKVSENPTATPTPTEKPDILDLTNETLSSCSGSKVGHMWELESGTTKYYKCRFCNTEKSLMNAAGDVKAMGICGEHCYWSVDQKGVLRIWGSGDMFIYGTPNSSKSYSKGEMGLGIAPWMKYWTKEINSIKVERGVTSISDGAFACVDLDSSTPFSYEKKFADISFSDTIEKIGYKVFWGVCYDNLTIPKSVKAWTEDVLSASNIDTVTFAEGIREIHKIGSNNVRKFVLPSSVNSLEDKAFMGSGSLEEINLPYGITEIPQLAFSGCKKLKSITIPSSVTKIGQEAFGNCDTLTTVTIPSGVTALAFRTFFQCKNLESVTIPESVTVLNYFNVLCDKLKDIYYQGSEASWKKVTIYGTEYLDKAKVHYAKPTATPTATPKPTVTPTATPRPSVTPKPTATPKPTVTPTATPRPTATPKPTAIPTPQPTVTATPKPTATPALPTGKFTVKLSAATVAYNGKTQTPSITVTYKGKKLSGKYYTVKCNNNKNIGTATVTVTGKGNYKKCSGKATFKIVLKKSTLSSLKAGKKSATLSWKTITGSTGYQIQYSTSKNFSKAKTVKIAGAGKRSTTIKKLTSKKTYYVRIRAYKIVNKKTVYGAWSVSKKVVVK